MTPTEAKEWLKQQVKWQSEPCHSGTPGGQSCGMPPMAQTLISEDTSIMIKVGFHRSALKNRELAMLLFELALEDLIT